jgi:hypothetical protein
VRRITSSVRYRWGVKVFSQSDVGRNINATFQRKKHLLNNITFKTKIMKTKILTFTAIVLTLISCSQDNDVTNTPTTTPNNVLVLKVDYNTNQFEGGKELSFTNTASDMTVTNQYVPPYEKRHQLF